MYAGVPTERQIPVTLVYKEIVFMAIRLPGMRRALTDKVHGLWGESVNDVFPKTWMPTPRQTTRMLGTLRLPTTVAAKSHAGAMNLAEVALYSPLATHAQSVPAGLHKNHKGEAPGQAARLAAWEDEGGATACVK
jgi:hypothetical protein